MKNSNYKEAKKRVKLKKDFYTHLVLWMTVSFFLFALNLLTNPGHIWAFYPFLGWGMAVAFQGWVVFSKNWEDREIQKELKKLGEYDEDYESLELEDEIELQDFKKLRDDWKDSDFV